MQNEDEELRGLEKKLGRLRPREMDESYVDELTGALGRERDELTERRNDGSYPPNVLWIRFAPVAAAAGVVLLGTFFLRYESQMGEMQAQRNDSPHLNSATNLTPSNNGMVFAGKGNTGSEELSSPASQLGSLPVPRLGVGENYGSVTALPGASSLLPASAQNYIQPGDGEFGVLYHNAGQVTGSLHFEDAYDWHETENQQVKVKDQKSATGAQGAKAIAQ